MSEKNGGLQVGLVRKGIRLRCPAPHMVSQSQRDLVPLWSVAAGRFPSVPLQSHGMSWL